jgi:hypothetical protein
VLDRSEQHHTGIVDHRVESSEFGDHTFHRAECLVTVRDVRLNGEDRRSVGPQFGCEIVEPIEPSSDKRYGCAVLGKSFCSRFTNAAGCAGDQGHGAFERGRHRSTLVLRWSR